MTQDFNRRELCRFVSHVLEGTLTESVAQRFELLLATSVDARQLYYRTISLHADLVWEFSNTSVAIGASQAVDSGKKPTDSPNPHAIKLSGWRSSAAGLLLQFFRGLNAFSRTSPIMMTCLIATLVYGSFSLLVWQMSLYEAVEYQTESNFVAGLTPAQPVAKVVQEVECRWQGEDAPRTGDILGPCFLKLVSGAVKLRFNDGAITLIEGPCEFEVVTSKSGFLRRGKLVALVPPSAVGFELKTPTAAVIDLGTEFGVEVQPQGNTAVEVFQGKVRVESLASRKETSPQAIVLQANSRRRVQVDAVTGLEVIEEDQANPIAFKRSLLAETNAVAKDLSLATSHELIDVFMVDKPLAIWRFAEARKGIVWNAVGKEHHGRLLGGTSKQSPGVFDGEDDYGEFRNLVEGSFTIEICFKTNTPGLPGRAPNFGRGLVWGDVLGEVDDYALTLHQGVVAFWESERGDVDSRFVIGKTNVTDDRWHHIALTRQRGKSNGIKLYVDGSLDAEGKAHDNALVSSELTFVGGMPDLEAWRYFAGQIDFLAIYDHVLDTSAITRHCQTAAREEGHPQK